MNNFFRLIFLDVFLVWYTNEVEVQGTIFVNFYDVIFVYQTFTM